MSDIDRYIILEDGETELSPDGDLVYYSAHLKDKAAAMAEKDREIVEKDNWIIAQDRAIEEHGKVIDRLEEEKAEKDAEIERLKKVVDLAVSQIVELTDDCPQGLWPDHECEFLVEFCGETDCGKEHEKDKCWIYRLGKKAGE